MSFIKRLYKLVSTSSNVEVEVAKHHPIIGGKYKFRDTDPWDVFTLTVTDIKDGWVRYTNYVGYASAVSLTNFNYIYKPV